MGVGWCVGIVVAGVGEDRTVIPLPKKVGLTAGAGAIVALFALRRTYAGLGCGVVFALAAAFLLAVMWFWN